MPFLSDAFCVPFGAKFIIKALVTPTRSCATHRRKNRSAMFLNNAFHCHTTSSISHQARQSISVLEAFPTDALSSRVKLYLSHATPVCQNVLLRSGGECRASEIALVLLLRI